MALPSSGQISFSQLALELGNNCLNVSLRDYSACANLTSPDSIAELYGKSCCVLPSSWSAGGNLIYANSGHASVGTQDAGLSFGGYVSGNLSFEYNGTSWELSAFKSQNLYNLAGFGTQNSAVSTGGRSPFCSATEEYNGTSWSTGGVLITAKAYFAGAGTQNEGLSMGGYNSSFSILSNTEEYDGTSWSTGCALILGRSRLTAAGTQNAGLAIGGGYPNNMCTEEYNGTSWSTGCALITGRYGLAGAGTQNAGLVAGGYAFDGNTVRTCTEEYNGTSWSTGCALITGRVGLAGAGTQSAGLVAGGQNNVGVSFACTEEYSPGKCLG